jgi:hypothetical protein
VYKDKDELLAKARAMAKRIASHSAMVVQGAKIVLNYSDEHTVAEGLEYVGLWNGNFMQRCACLPPNRQWPRLATFISQSLFSSRSPNSNVSRFLQ